MQQYILTVCSVQEQVHECIKEYTEIKEEGTSSPNKLHRHRQQTQEKKKYVELGRYDLKLSLCSDYNALLCFEI